MMSQDAPRRDVPRPRLGRLLEVLGTIGLVVCFIVYAGDIIAAAARNPTETDAPVPIFGWWTVAMVAAWGSLKVVHWGRRMRVLPGAELLARDGRPPVLYLRSFRDDPVAHKPFDSWLWLTRVNYRTEEEELAATFADVGPLVAVGAPREVLPQLGAARFYFTDEEWKDRVGELMASARLVLLRRRESRPGLGGGAVRAHALS